MDINNLTNVYNSNPTLQGQYTLQQYLDLFGGSATTPTPTPTPDPDPTPDPGLPSIINQNINQGGGDGGDGLPPGPTFNRNDLLGTPDYFPGKGFKETIGDGITGIIDYAKTGGMFGNVIRGIFGKKKNIEKQTSIKTADKARDIIEAERKAEIERVARAAAIERANRPYSGPTYYNNQDTNTMGGSGGAISQDFNNTTASIDNYSADVLRARGGLMGKGGSGLVTMFKEKR